MNDKQTELLEGVKRAASTVAEQRRHLDEALVRAYREGVSLRKLGPAAGLSHEAVRMHTLRTMAGLQGASGHAPTRPGVDESVSEAC